MPIDRTPIERTPGMRDRPAGGLLMRLALSRNGAAAIEFAFGFPIFLALVYMMFEFARIFWSQSTLEYAIEEAARYAMVNSTATSAEVETVATDSAIGLPTGDLTIVVTFTDVNGTRGLVSIIGTYAYTPMMPIVVPFFATSSTIDFAALQFDIVTTTQMSIVQ
jgi:hypothetical protein